MANYLRWAKMTELQQFARALTLQSNLLIDHPNHDETTLDCPGCYEQGTLSEFCQRKRELEHGK